MILPLLLTSDLALGRNDGSYWPSWQTKSTHKTGVETQVVNVIKALYLFKHNQSSERNLLYYLLKVIQTF